MRFSLVATCTVSDWPVSPASTRDVSGDATAKFPPRATKTRTRPAHISRIASIVESPGARGGAKPNSRSSASRKAGRGRSQMPIVRSPCTLLWPRTGQGPAPGFPMLPRSSSRFISSCTFPTPCRCWVSPIAQQAMVRSLAA